jgi:hypothetical protein
VAAGRPRPIGHRQWSRWRLVGESASLGIRTRVCEHAAARIVSLGRCKQHALQQEKPTACLALGNLALGRSKEQLRCRERSAGIANFRNCREPHACSRGPEAHVPYRKTAPIALFFLVPRKTPSDGGWAAPAPEHKNMRSAPPRLPSYTCVLRDARRAQDVLSADSNRLARWRHSGASVTVTLSSTSRTYVRPTCTNTRGRRRRARAKNTRAKTLG